MAVTLPEELQRFVEDQVATGIYVSEAEVLREAIELLRERNEYLAAESKHLRAAIDQGIADLDSGRSRPECAKEISLIKRGVSRRLLAFPSLPGRVTLPVPPRLLPGGSRATGSHPVDGVKRQTRDEECGGGVRSGEATKYYCVPRADNATETCALDFELSFTFP